MTSQKYKAASKAQNTAGCRRGSLTVRFDEYPGWTTGAGVRHGTQGLRYWRDRAGTGFSLEGSVRMLCRMVSGHRLRTLYPIVHVVAAP